MTRSPILGLPRSFLLSCLLLLCMEGRDLLEGPGIKFAEAVLDNGKFGTRSIRFETGSLAQQAQGAAVASLDEETMLLSPSSISKQPKEQFDFFPLFVDVEERS